MLLFALVTAIVWAAGWCCFLQSMYYGYIKDNHPDENTQSNSAWCQTVWAVGGVLVLVLAGWFMIGLAAN